MELKELKSLLKLLRDNGVLQYQSQELNLVLSETFTPPRKVSMAADPALVGEDTEDAPEINGRQLTPEDAALVAYMNGETDSPESN